MFVLALAKYGTMGGNFRRRMGRRWVVEPRKCSPTMPSGSRTGSRAGSKMFFAVAASWIHFGNTEDILAGCFSFLGAEVGGAAEGPGDSSTSISEEPESGRSMRTLSSSLSGDKARGKLSGAPSSSYSEYSLLVPWKSRISSSSAGPERGC